MLAAYLSPGGYGSLNLYNTIILILTILVPLGTTGYISTNYFRKDKLGIKHVLNTVLFIGVCVFFFLLLIFIVGGTNLENLLGLSLKVQVIALLVCFTQFFTIINLEIWRLQEQPIKYGVYTMALVILNFALTLYFVIIQNMDWEGRIYAQLFVNSVFFVISIFFLFKRKYLLLAIPNKRILKETLLFGIPLIPHMLTGWMRQGIDRYIINFFLGVSSVGLFGFALNFGNIIIMVGTAFNASNAVFIYKKLASGDIDTIEVLRKQTRIMIVFFLILFLVVFAISYTLIPFIFPQYLDSRPFLFPLCLAGTFQCMYLLYVNYLFYYKKTNILMCITVGISLLHIVLSYIFTKTSVVYTSYINLFSNFIIFVLVAIYASKLTLKNQLNNHYCQR